MFDDPEFDNHEEVVVISDPETGLRAVIAIHSTALGPGLGGIRYWNYAHHDEAVSDALRLSRGMTFKNALAGLDLGGAKAVIFGDPGKPKSKAQLAAFARAVDRLEGKYIGAEDVGMSVADIDIMRDITPHLAGTSWGAAASGDPSPFTAEGVFLAMQTAAEAKTGSSDLKGSRVGILGIGSVGWSLAEKLHAAGAQLLVADLNKDRVERAVDAFGADFAVAENLAYEQMDIFAPCALGGALDEKFVSKSRAQIICGAANNQLSTPEIDAMLWQAGKLYAPDYLVNAGGVINVAAEAYGEYDAYRVNMTIRLIPQTARDVFEIAKKTDTPTGKVADEMAMARIQEAQNPMRVVA